MSEARTAQSILVVEDEQDIRELIGLCLGEQGYKVRLAEDGESAVASFETEQPPPDLIILDVQLPGMDGVEVCRAIRRTSKAPVIFLTCKHEADDIVEGLEAGGDDYIAKPFDLNVLIARIRANLRRVSEYADGLTPEGEPPNRAVAPFEPLTVRELELLRLIKAGLSNQEIAERLHLTLGTVKGYNNRIFAKLGAKSRTQALGRAEELRLL